MSLRSIQQILENEIGFDPSRVSYVALENVVRKRIKKLDIVDLEDYALRLTENLSELQFLIENVVVPETWFFRHRKVFQNLMPEFDQLAQRYHTQGRVIRCLSLACSTGEEPYSLAIALTDRGLPGSAFNIDAIDISENALEKARLARYGTSSFRADMSTPPDKHFTPAGNKHILRSHISNSVSFNCLNVLDTQQLKSLGQYDIIFCRNMLIYFSTSRQKQVLLQIASNLNDTGILAVSPAEAALVTQHLQLHQLDASIPLFYADKNTQQSSLDDTQDSGKPAQPCDNKPYTHPAREFSKKCQDRKIQLNTFSTNDVSRAWELTDKGRLKEARSLCEKMLSKHFSIPEVLYLLGVIEMTLNEYGLAESHFRQHLVYQPNHLNALRYRQQALLQLQRVEEADWCQARIHRLAAQTPTELS